MDGNPTEEIQELPTDDLLEEETPIVIQASLPDYPITNEERELAKEIQDVFDP